MLENYPDVLTFAQLCEALQIGKSLAYFLLQRILGYLKILFE